MTQPISVGIVGGAGWLGTAFASAMVDAGIVAAEQLTLSYRSSRPVDKLPDARWTRNNQEVFDRSDLVILSVRPQDYPTVDVVTEGKLIISVMAGISLGDLGERFKTERVVRTLPNGAAEVRKSYTPWIAGKLTSVDRTVVQSILEACGTADEVGTEADIDYLTGLTGSGPAFPALLAVAMMEDAVRHGIDSAIARRGVTALLVGTGRLIEQTKSSPEELVEMFMQYRGTTAAAIEAMRAANFSEAVGQGLRAAYEKSISMGNVEGPRGRS